MNPNKVSDEAAIMHTPGPWEIGKRHERIIAPHYYASRELANSNPVAHVYDWENTGADVRLIAAAPDLLDVAITLCNQFALAGIDAVEDSNCPGEMLHFKARAAIAKAKGE